MRLSDSMVLVGVLATGCAKHMTFDDSPDGGGAGKPMSDPPHAEGNVYLGEAHGANGAGTVTPIVGVSFVPDSMAVKACSDTVGGCTLVKAPKCASACMVGEVCAYDDSCTPTCKRVCTKQCANDEECYFPNQGADPQCRTRETFDSGPVAFAGTTLPITLYPPYRYSGPSTGAPFLAGAEITVQGSGAQGAGFTMWEQKVTATTFLQTQLAKLPQTSVYGTNPLPIDWTPGKDKIVITLSGVGGSVTCEADDTRGHYDVDRDAVDAALGTASTLSISVSRQRQDVKKGVATKGTLTSAKVQSEGWVKVTTSSTESMSFQGCQGGLAMCGGTCKNLLSDSQTAANAAVSARAAGAAKARAAPPRAATTATRRRRAACASPRSTRARTTPRASI